MIHDIRMFQETQHSQLLTHLCFNWRKIILPPGSQLEPLKAAAASHCPIAWLPHEGPPYVPAMTGRHGDSSKWVPHGQDNSELFSMSNCFSHMENVWVISPLHMGVSKNRGTPKWMVKIMENPIKMDDLGVPLFLETSISFIHPKTATCIGSIWAMLGTVASGFQVLPMTTWGKILVG